MPELLSVDRELIYGGDEDIPLISLRWLCTCWVCYQIQEDAKKDFESKLELGVFSLNTEGKGCLAQTLCKHWSFAHEIHLIPTCMEKLFTCLWPASRADLLWMMQKVLSVCGGSGGIWGCSTLVGGECFVSVVLMSPVQFGWWKQFSCPCSVLFTQCTFTCTQLMCLELCCVLICATVFASWWNVLRTNFRTWFSEHWLAILGCQHYNYCEVCYFTQLSSNHWIVLSLFKERDLVDNLPRNCSLSRGSTLGITCVSLNTCNISVHPISFVLFWLYLDRCEWWKISLLWHLSVFCSVLLRPNKQNINLCSQSF